ncbi:MAG: ribonuclease M5 [Acholeplasmataceae bacterium]|jgi:ribonuclease M5
MKKIYVVEGIRDEEILKKLNPNIITIKTNGFSFDDKLIKQLQNLEKDYQIILILDPDYPGGKIRRELSEKLKNPVHIYIPREKAISKDNKKIGLEHVDVNELKIILNHKVIFNNDKLGSLTTTDLVNLGLTGSQDSQERRLKISNHYYLPKSNAKRLLNYLNQMNISYEEIERILNES